MPRTSQQKPLSCGGKGPCCHINYSHRHCEHCDEVIAVAPYWWQYINPVPTSIRPYQPYWNTFNNIAPSNNFGNAGNAAIGFAQALENSWKAAAADSSLNVKALPDPTVAHACEVK